MEESVPARVVGNSIAMVETNTKTTALAMVDVSVWKMFFHLLFMVNFFCGIRGTDRSLPYKSS